MTWDVMRYIGIDSGIVEGRWSEVQDDDSERSRYTNECFGGAVSLCKPRITLTCLPFSVFNTMHAASLRG